MCVLCNCVFSRSRDRVFPHSDFLSIGWWCGVAESIVVVGHKEHNVVTNASVLKDAYKPFDFV